EESDSDRRFVTELPTTQASPSYVQPFLCSLLLSRGVAVPPSPLYRVTTVESCDRAPTDT
ncbi:hypothetical protein BJV78DRAFT_1202095, partial [Lactifluus subvellereus]